MVVLVDAWMLRGPATERRYRLDWTSTRTGTSHKNGGCRRDTRVENSFTYIGERALLTIVHVGDGDLALRHVIVVIDVVGQHTLICWWVGRIYQQIRMILVICQKR